MCTVRSCSLLVAHYEVYMIVCDNILIYVSHYTSHSLLCRIYIPTAYIYSKNTLTSTTDPHSIRKWVVGINLYALFFSKICYGARCAHACNITVDARTTRKCYKKKSRNILYRCALNNQAIAYLIPIISEKIGMSTIAPAMPAPR